MGNQLDVISTTKGETVPIRPGSIVGGHRIIRLLGAGSYGAVYLARHPRLAQRTVALKVLHDSYSGDPKARSAFDREAELVTQLDHPNIIDVYDRNDTEDPHLWLSMRHVAGGDLASLPDTGPPLDLQRIVRIITDVARALDHAHGRNVLHRDVKPANILIESDPDGERAILTDFGIARALDTPTSTHTAATLAYTAPERFNRQHPVTHRADIYSLGATLYRLLTGQIPFPGNDDAALIAGHLYRTPEAVVTLRADLPHYLDHVITTALAKNPEDRYASALDLATAASHAITATSFAPTSSLGTDRSDPHQVHTEALRLKEEEDFDRAETLFRRAADNGLPDAMMHLADLLEKRGEPEQAEGWVLRAAEAGHAQAMEIIGSLHLERGEHAEAEAWLTRAVSAGDDLAKFGLGTLYRQTDNMAKAEHWYRQAADDGNINAVQQLGWIHQQRGDLDQAEHWYRIAADAGDNAAISGLGWIRQQHGDLTEARTLYERAAAAGYADSMRLLAWLYRQRGELAQVDSWFRRAADAGSTIAMREFGALFEQLGEWEIAETWFRRAVDSADVLAMIELAQIQDNRGDTDDAEKWLLRAAETGNIQAMKNLASLHQRLGDRDSALTWYQRVAETGDTEAMQNLAMLHSASGDLDAAQTWYESAAEAGDTSAMRRVAALHSDRGNPNAAQRWLQRAAEAGDTKAMAGLAKELVARGDIDAAVVWYERGHNAGDWGVGHSLGLLYEQQDEPEKALHVYRILAERGDVFVYGDLLRLLEDLDPAEAEMWRQRKPPHPFRSY
ncbi:protein kinase [Nocardia asteroides]|uniref:protein kinase domain-containing protein n=1 Tax=Nocardia asteroides TaxID=1824 RepID=UPI0037CB283D